jgi:hypothetical protein
VLHNLGVKRGQLVEDGNSSIWTSRIQGCLSKKNEPTPNKQKKKTELRKTSLPQKDLKNINKSQDIMVKEERKKERKRIL